MSDELSKADTLRLALQGMPTLADQQEYLRKLNMTELGELAALAGVVSPAKAKVPLVDQVIAKLLSGENALASTDQGVLSVEERKRGAPLPAKVASYRPDELWPIMSGWEIDQGLAEDARATYSEDDLREYLGYLWDRREIGIPPKQWKTIAQYFDREATK